MNQRQRQRAARVAGNLSRLQGELSALLSPSERDDLDNVITALLEIALGERNE